ncbi:MAG: quinolinate synthase NadA [Bacillota bacterium]|nr:quinolinate synthase NadA [Bacillota bacterium]
MTGIQERILSLKHEKNAVILAHFYQTMDIQKIADHVGDSFELACRAQAADESTIILCGVRFMAESAKILNPDKKVLLPAPDAGCPMADMVTAEDIVRLKKQYPDAAVMCYVNSSADVKAECDICCTSSSAVKIARSLSEKRIIFVPDQNLGAYVASQVPDKEFILYQGFCPIHHHVSASDVTAAKTVHPEARVLIHPECRSEVVKLADYVGSTSGIIDYVKNSADREFIIGTEMGVVERLKRIAPEKNVYLLATRLVCPNMKKTRISDVLNSLENDVYEITLPEYAIKGAFKCLDRMVKVQ